MRRLSRGTKFLLFIPLLALGILVFGGIVMLLWNNVLAVVLNVSTVTFWQALGILALSKILFSSFGGGRYRRNYYWKQRMEEKWANMTPEEKEKMKDELKNRWGSWGGGGC